MSFIKKIFKRNIPNLSLSELITWFKENAHEIFVQGDIHIEENGIEWRFGKENNTIKIKWSEVLKIYEAQEQGSHKLFIEDNSGNQIKFYVSNKDKQRDKFHFRLKQLAKLKGAQLQN